VTGPAWRTSCRARADRGELHLDYQPIVDAADGRLVGVEALLRWSNPRRGEIPPDVVISLAEQSGQINEIGRWVLEQAWAERQHWPSDHTDQTAMSVNVSAHQFMSGGFAAMVAEVLGGGAAIDPRLLTLEVTEDVFVRDGERALVVVNDLKEMGVTIALDDFGTGYSSLSYLMAYPVDTVKVDQTFVAKLAQNPAGRTIVTAVVQLAHGLGMTVVSEGVETIEQHVELAELGCDACQGFYFARPMPATSLESLIAGQDDGASLSLPPARPRFPPRKLSPPVSGPG
jgi:EAL domain-containing protein (putative c-di-GMP-specific phosphodiesterase class I)